MFYDFFQAAIVIIIVSLTFFFRQRKAVGKLDEARFPEEMKTNFKKAIITEMISSEDESLDTDGNIIN